MIEFVSYLSSAIFITLSILYIYFRIHKMKFKIDIRLIITFVLSVFTFTVTYKYSPQFIRQMAILVLLFNISFYYFTLDIKKSSIDAIYLEILCIISEIIYAIIYFLLNSQVNVVEWNHTIVGTIVSNIFIPLVMVLISNTKKSKQLFNSLNKVTVYLSKNKVAVILLSFFAIVNLLFYTMYFVYYNNKEILFITISALFFLYTMIMLLILNTTGRYEHIKGKYSLSLENLKEYEEMLNQYRVSVHENKNQLLLIRNMIKSRKVINYIDKLVDNKDKDDKDIYNIVKRIPSSSIRAVVYSKILLMRNKNIDCSVNISRKISTKDFSALTDELTLDICNILNVFIDNAIDEVRNSDIKQVLIELNKDNDIIEITISNICNKSIDVNKIYETGYSTKGRNHGYGLSIVKNTINKHPNILKNKAEYINNIFSQYLYIDIKKCSE